jgi:hypothetical protein
MAKNPAAVSLGRKGGKAYAKNHSTEERKQAARRAAQARWEKAKQEAAKKLKKVS